MTLENNGNSNGETVDTKGTSGEESREDKPERLNEYKNGQHDAFTEAFNDAKAELSVGDEKPKPKAKPKEAAPAKQEAKPKTEKIAKQPTEDAEEGEDGEEDAAGADGKAEKKGPLEPKKWWSGRKREAFKFQPRHVQEAWIDEAPTPDQRWTPEQKEAFAKVPREGQEIILERAQEIERGYGEKFEGLAKERKLAEEIRAAIPANMREYFSSRGITEAQAFTRLMQLQQMATADPIGYVRKFIVDAKINPADLFQADGEGRPVIQPSAGHQADFRSHPEFQAMANELQQLRADRQRSFEAETQRFVAELDGILSEGGDDGNPRFPLIRILAEPMARIIESEPDRFSGLSIRDRIAAAYSQALDDFPELATVHAAPKPKADEHKADNADHDEGQRVAKLERAVTPKSRTPQPAPATAHGDPFEEAWMSARKQLKR